MRDSSLREEHKGRYGSKLARTANGNELAENGGQQGATQSAKKISSRSALDHIVGCSTYRRGSHIDMEPLTAHGCSGASRRALHVMDLEE